MLEFVDLEHTRAALVREAWSTMTADSPARPPAADSPPCRDESGATAAEGRAEELRALNHHFRTRMIALGATAVASAIGIGLTLAWRSQASARLLLMAALGGCLSGALSTAVSAWTGTRTGSISPRRGNTSRC
jgi:hypothetical protein